MRLLSLYALVWGAAFVVPAQAQVPDNLLLPAIDDRWSRYESPNFELFSDDSEHEARHILHDLEVLRAIFLGESGDRERRRLPVSIYTFRNGSDFDFYAKHREDSDKRLAGLYVHGPDRAHILLRPMREREEARAVAFHEYVHHMFRAIEAEPPLWYNEGMADLLAGFKLERGKLSIGNPFLPRLLALQRGNLIPLEELFAAGKNSKYYTSRNHTGLFYAQSWALLHYLRFGKHKFDPEQVERFLTTAGDERRMARTNIKSLFEECFKIDYGRMEKQLARYVRRGSYTYGKLPVPELPSRESYQRTPLSAEEIKVHLAGVALRTAGSAAATIALLEAGRAEQPDPRIFESLGAEAWQREAIEDAVEHWSRAREHGSTNASILRELARHEWERWFVRAAMELRLPAEVATNLRDLLISGLELEPETDQAWEMLAWVEACSPQVSGKNVNAVQARIPTLKEKASTLTAIALCYVRVGNEAAAIELLEQLPRFEPDDWTLDGAEYALAKLKKVPREMISLGNNSALRHVGVHQVRENSTHYPSVPIPEGL